MMQAGRRRLLGRLGAGLLGSSLRPGRLAAATPAPSPPPDEQPLELAPGVFMFRGARGEPGPDNLGRTGNAAFVVGPGGVVAVDAGVSWRQGRQRLAAIERQTGRRPAALLLTQARQEFLFGAAAFEDAGVPLLMHADALALMRARCETCLRRLRQQLGEPEMHGTRLPRQIRAFDATQAPAALPPIGRALQLRVARDGRADACPGRAALLDADSGTLIAGALLDVETVPDVQDGELPAWLAQLDALAASAAPLRHCIGGHGPPGRADAVARTAHYLRTLQQDCAARLAEGLPLAEVADAVAPPAGCEDWDGLDSTHRRNASVVYLRLEQALLRARAAPSVLSAPSGGPP